MSNYRLCFSYHWVSLIELFTHVHLSSITYKLACCVRKLRFFTLPSLVIIWHATCHFFIINRMTLMLGNVVMCLHVLWHFSCWFYRIYSILLGSSWWLDIYFASQLKFASINFFLQIWIHYQMALIVHIFWIYTDFVQQNKQIKQSSYPEVIKFFIKFLSDCNVVYIYKSRSFFISEFILVHAYRESQKKVNTKNKILSITNLNFYQKMCLY